MNAPHDKPDLTPLNAVGQPPEEQWSALMDGELATDALPGLLTALARDADARLTCQRYQLIGDVLRTGAVAPAGSAPQAFVAGVRARLQAEPAAVQVSVPQVVTAVRGQAANDAVFRWKLVAGLASLAAVMAVSWSVIGGAPGAAGGSVAGPQMALLQGGGGTVVAGESAAPAAAVVVQTAQGPVLRDARLEELLAEHRQYGGMSALQMPAGFLRDATYQTAPQR